MTKYKSAQNASRIAAMIIACAVICVSLAGCGASGGSEEQTSPEPTSATAAQILEAKAVVTQAPDANFVADDSVDLDLSGGNGSKAYSEMSKMMSYPEKYEGKTVKVKGTFNLYTDPTTGVNYYGCVINDAMACCAQTMEFVPVDGVSYPDDFPQVNAQIAVKGTFDTYMENDFRYCTLRDATFEVL